MIRSDVDGAPIAVTGVGAITPFGVGVAPFARALREGRSAIRAAKLEPFEDARPFALLSPEYGADWLAALKGREPTRYELARRTLRKAPISLVASAAAAYEAWEQAGLTASPTEPRRSGLVVGGHDLAMGLEDELRSKFEASPHYLPPTYAVRMMDTDHVGVVSSLLDIRGEGFTVGGASASGNMAIIQGARLLRLGVVKRCLVIGALAELSPMALASLDALGALGGHAYTDAPERASRPFDANRDGFIYSQAAGAIVLEPRSDAERRGATVLGLLAGAGISLDGTHTSEPSSEGEARAMKRALGDASLSPEDVDTINAHGTSSRLGDEAELEALVKVFGARSADLRVQSTKGILGHSLWSAGVLEAVALLTQMAESFIHPNVNLDEPIRDDVGLVGSRATSPGPRVALSNSFGFGGINTSILIEHADHGR